MQGERQHAEEEGVILACSQFLKREGERQHAEEEGV
jgi:hypothetical protein